MDEKLEASTSQSETVAADVGRGRIIFRTENRGQRPRLQLQGACLI